jgi:hypothetical protein
MRKRFFSFIFFLFPLLGLCQQKNIPWNHTINHQVERYFYDTKNSYHTSFRPFVESRYNFSQYQDSALHNLGVRKYDSGWKKKVFSESLFIIEGDDYRFTIDPLVDFSFGNELSDNSTYSDTTTFYVNTRGFRVQGDIGKNLSFESFFFENQAFFPTYLRDYVERSGVVPGQGRTKPFKNSGFDYAFSEAYINFEATENLTISAGHGRQFIGEGYRSVILSDFAFNYPHLRFKSNFLNNRIEHTISYAYLQSLNRIPVATTPEALFQPKILSVNHTDIKIHKRFYLGITESVVWRIWDSNLGSRPLDFNFFNPIPFVHTVINKSTNNIFHGLTFKALPVNRLVLYGQLVAQQIHYSLDFPNQGLGYQLGIKSYNLPITGLFLRAEYNHATPFSYFSEDPLQNFSHYNQALAHPMGANFDELVFQLRYQFKRVFLNGHLILAKRNLGQLSAQETRLNNGSDIFLPLSNQNSPSSLEDFSFQSVEVGYLINPATNMTFKAGIVSRITKENGGVTATNLFLNIGLSSNLFNRYYDF